MDFALIRLSVRRRLRAVLYLADKLVFRKQWLAKAFRLWRISMPQPGRAGSARCRSRAEAQGLEDGAVRRASVDRVPGELLSRSSCCFPAAVVPVRAVSDSVGVHGANARIGDLSWSTSSTYGIRLPVRQQKFVRVGRAAARRRNGVSAIPLNPSQDYIKRVVGLPGDRIEYVNKQLTINGQPVPIENDGAVLRPRTDVHLSAVHRAARRYCTPAYR